MYSLVLATLVASAPAADPTYTKDVKPFLATYCTECHSGAKAKAGVKLDSLEALTAGKRAAVVAGEPDKSSLVKTMTGKGKQMPPKKFGKTPTADEIAMIKAWIAGGAKDAAAK